MQAELSLECLDSVKGIPPNPRDRRAVQPPTPAISHTRGKPGLFLIADADVPSLVEASAFSYRSAARVPDGVEAIAATAAPVFEKLRLTDPPVASSGRPVLRRDGEVHSSSRDRSSSPLTAPGL